MNTLPLGTPAPAFTATTLSGETLSSSGLEAGPVVICFSLPHVHAGRLVVGYLRRLKEQVPQATVVVILQGDEAAVRRYAEGYLANLLVVHDADLALSRAYRATHVPTIYYLEEGTIKLAFTGFVKSALNKLAELATAATGAKAKELIGPSDNKGDYELAERGLA